MSDLLFEVSQGVGLITLNRPQVMNAFGGSLREDLLACLRGDNWRGIRFLRRGGHREHGDLAGG